MGGKQGKRGAQCNPYGWEVERREGGERGGVREERGERGDRRGEPIAWSPAHVYTMRQTVVHFHMPPPPHRLCGYK